MQPDPNDEDSGYSRDYDETARYQLRLHPHEMLRWLLKCESSDFIAGDLSDTRLNVYPATTSQTNDLTYTYSLNHENGAASNRDH